MTRYLYRPRFSILLLAILIQACGSDETITATLINEVLDDTSWECLNRELSACDNPEDNGPLSCDGFNIEFFNFNQCSIRWNGGSRFANFGFFQQSNGIQVLTLALDPTEADPFYRDHTPVLVEIEEDIMTYTITQSKENNYQTPELDLQGCAQTRLLRKL